MKTLIKFEEINLKFKNNRIFDNLNLEIKKGEILAILGKSGKGKSTLLKILLGFIKQDNGNIYIEDIKLREDNIEKLRKNIGYISQENSFYDNLTVIENMKYFGNLYGIERKRLKAIIHRLLHLVGLTSHKKTITSKLSGGQKRRLEFIISLIHEPEILIFDEPFTGLDPDIIIDLWKIIKKIKTDGVTIIIISHNLKSIEENADRAVILKNGKIKHEVDLKFIRQSKVLSLEKEFLKRIK